MNTSMLAQRLSAYAASDALAKEHALKEITQEIILSGLARTHFFAKAAFTGGTCLRIFWGLQRFSEDLDFSLLQAETSFVWQPYLKSIQSMLAAFGYQVEVQDRSKLAKNAVRVAFVKDASIGQLMLMQPPNISRGPAKAIKIKLEVDTLPPSGAHCMQQYCNFPTINAVTVHTLPSLFAGKCHALLCRRWVKGRDWFDFTWYVGRQTSLNYALLSSALNQAGPWKAQGIVVDLPWFLAQMAAQIRTIDWPAQVADIARFLRPAAQAELKLWSTRFFLNRLEFFANYATKS